MHLAECVQRQTCTLAPRYGTRDVYIIYMRACRRGSPNLTDTDAHRLSVAAHAVRAREPAGTGPAARAAVVRVVSHRDAPPAAAQPAERAPLPARAAVARAGQHVGAQAAAALELPFAGDTTGAGARASRVPTAARVADLPRSPGGGEEPACGNATGLNRAAAARRCVWGGDDCRAQARGRRGGDEDGEEERGS